MYWQGFQSRLPKSDADEEQKVQADILLRSLFTFIARNHLNLNVRIKDLKNFSDMGFVAICQ